MLTGIRRAHEKGISLIEFVIAVAILALLVALGMPSFTAMIQNSQIRTAAESILAGLQTTRNEAVRQNTNAEFVLTSAGVTGGTGWTSRIVRNNTTVQSAPDGEGSGNVILATSPNGSASVTFNGFGRLPAAPAINADGTPCLTQVDVDVAPGSLPAGSNRPLRVTISSGGEIRMCDPAITDATDPRKC